MVFHSLHRFRRSWKEEGGRDICLVRHEIRIRLRRRGPLSLSWKVYQSFREIIKKLKKGGREGGMDGDRGEGGREGGEKEGGGTKEEGGGRRKEEGGRREEGRGKKGREFDIINDKNIMSTTFL